MISEGEDDKKSSEISKTNELIGESNAPLFLFNLKGSGSQVLNVMLRPMATIYFKKEHIIHSSELNKIQIKNKIKSKLNQLNFVKFKNQGEDHFNFAIRKPEGGKIIIINLKILNKLFVRKYCLIAASKYVKVKPLKMNVGSRQNNPIQQAFDPFYYCVKKKNSKNQEIYCENLENSLIAIQSNG